MNININKDLVDASMMISCIILVLIGTTQFDTASTKVIVMSILGILTILLGTIRFLNSKNQTH